METDKIQSTVFSTDTETKTNMPIHVNDFDKICRTCFSTVKIQPIFALKYNETAIVSFLDSSASIHVRVLNCY